MTVETVSSIFIPQVLARLVEAGFPEVPVLFNSGAVVPDFTMPYGADQWMTTVSIPYVTAPNVWSLLSDGSPLTPVTVGIGNAAGNSTSPETATVQRAGIMVDFTTRARANPLDPYGQARTQMLAGWAQAMEDSLVTAASSSTGWSAYTYDCTVLPDTTLNTFAVVSGAQLLGSEGLRDPFVLGMVHSHTLTSMLNRVNALGMPWMVEKAGVMADGSVYYRLLPFGTLLFVSDRIAPVTSNGTSIFPSLTSGTSVYTSVFCRRNSLALWVNPELSARSVQVPSQDSQQDALNSYYAAHRYFRVSGKSKPGVVLVNHT